MAEAPSPDCEVHFKVVDEIGQGDQPPLSPIPVMLGNTPIPDANQESSQFLPRFSETPPTLPFMENRLSNHHRQNAETQILVKPEPYNGKDDWDEYLSHFQDCAELGRWSNRTKLLFLAASLRGQARTFYMSLSAEDKESYQSLINKLNQRFGSTRNQNRWLSKLEMRRRLPEESIAVLGDDIRQMAQRAYYNLDLNAQEALALNQLYKIISLEMKCRCIDKDCRTVAEAVDVIERYESIIGDGADKRKSNVRAVESTTASKQTYDDRRAKEDLSTSQVISALQNLTSRLDRLENNATRNQGRFEKPYQQTKTCYICQSPEHFMKSCPYRDRTQQYHQGKQNQSSTNSKNTKSQGNARPLAH